MTEVSTPEEYYNDRFIYNDEECCTTYLDAEGGKKLYRYNEDNLVTSITDPLGREEVSVWEGMKLQSRTDALGRTTEYSYTEEGDTVRCSGVTAGMREASSPGLRHRRGNAGNISMTRSAGASASAVPTGTSQVWIFTGTGTS